MIEGKLDDDALLKKAMHDQLEALDPRSVDDWRLAFYQQVVEQMRSGEFHRIVSPDPIDEIGKFGGFLGDISDSLDTKFAQIHALSQLTTGINEGLFLDEVLDHIFSNFHALIPYDRIGFALLEDRSNGSVVRAHWARSDFAQVMIYKDYALPLAKTSLGEVAQSRRPRIINDLQAYLEDHPTSASTKRMVEEGARSSLTCPLLTKDKCMGFMFFSSRFTNAYGPDHVDILSQIAGQMALTLDKGRLYGELTQRNRFIRRIFGRYISDDIADVLLNDPKALKLGGDKRLVTILMSDLRSFTSMSERISPEKVVATLNSHLKVMVEIIHQHGGTIDNFIGDAILALFGAPLSRSDDALRAVSCAVAMQAGMAEVNRYNKSLDLPELAMGIGINTGQVVAGNIGSEMQTKYSVIGAPVNLAARIESLTEGGQVLISETTLAAAGQGVRVRGSRKAHVKGVKEAVEVYDVEGVDPEFVTPF